MHSKKLSAWGYDPSKRQPKLFKAWQRFIKSGEIEKDIVPSHVAESWVRSRDYNIDPYHISADAYLPEDQYRKLIHRNKHLINIASPILKNLFESFGKAYYVVALYDRNGYHLVRLAQPEDLRMREKQGIRMGLRFDEETVGTCGVSLVKRLKKTLRVVGCEHYLSLLHQLSSVYAPIFRPKTDDLLGVIAVGGASFIHYPYAESIVVAASTAIENLLELDKAKEELSVYSKSLQLTIDSLDDGIIVVDRNGHVYEMNMPARKLLGLGPADNLDMPVSSLPSCEPLNELIQGALNAPDPKSGRTECRIGPKTFIVEVKSAYDEWGHVKGVLVQMKDIQDLSRTFQGVAEHQPRYSIENIIGSSKAIGEIKHLIQIAASSEGPVIIEGESGTGKEIVAQAIHNASNRRNKPFVAINCAAIPLELIEATIFGHEKGAFTGATRTQIGKFELAENGTLFLDEIADMPEPMQAKMLRAIGERRIERVGGKDPISIDVRILTATNKNLIEQVQKVKFRQDLFYRLNVFRIVIPPLRERKEDIPDLVYHFINEFAPVLKKRILKVSKSFIDALTEQPFPGNVRELRNAIQYSMAGTDAGTLTAANLKGFFLHGSLDEKKNIKIPGKGERLAEIEKQIIQDTLKACRGNKTKAARMLGIGRATLYRRLDSSG